MHTELVGPSPRIAVDVHGEGELVVFMHGIGGNRTNWATQLQCAGERFTAAAWDARGYGDSDDYEGALAFADFTADLCRVLDHFKAERAHLVGLSMGGRIAMHFALAHPQRVRSLTLADTHEGFTSFTPEKRREFVETRRAPLLAGAEPRDIAPTVARSLVGAQAPAAVLQLLIDSISALHKESYIKSLQATVDQVTVGDISLILAPTLFIVGTCDNLTPPSLSHQMAARINGATVVEIPGAGHLSNLEQPELFNAALMSFLTRVSRQSQP